MTTYRLKVSNHDRLLGYFESNAPWSEAAVKEIAAVLLKQPGYQLELLVAQHEKRLLESGPEGIRVVSSEPIFESRPLSL